jgi:hypothetical protein
MCPAASASQPVSDLWHSYSFIPSPYYGSGNDCNRLCFDIAERGKKEIKSDTLHSLPISFLFFFLYFFVFSFSRCYRFPSSFDSSSVVEEMLLQKYNTGRRKKEKTAISTFIAMK